MSNNDTHKNQEKQGKSREFSQEFLDHQFKPGQSGNPNGRHKKESTYSDILRGILESDEAELVLRSSRLDENGNRVENKKKLIHLKTDDKKPLYNAIALSLLRKALTGDVSASKEIIDRVQGKAIQQIDHTTGGNTFYELSDKFMPTSGSDNSADESE